MGALTIGVLVAFGAIAVRLVDLQVVNAQHYRDLALEQRLRTVPLPAERGSVFDRNGRDLAISVQRSSIYADPRVVTDPATAAARLAPIVGVDEATLVRRLSDRTRRFVYVQRRVSDGVAEAVRALSLPGIGFVPESQREYPAGSLAAPVLGRVGGDASGLDGFEYMYDDLLTGKPGELVVERDQRGHEIPRTERSRVEAQRGTDLVLTIDQALQYQVERTLVDQVTATTAKGGMAVVLDIPTGEVLAMAVVQGATPEGPARPAVAGERNRPLTDVFEPGSTNKVITIASSIEHGLIGPSTEFDVPGWIRVGPATFKDVHPHETERWSVTDIVRESSNVGTIMISEQLGKERLDAALRAFGLGERTSLDFPGQAAGLLIDPEEYYATGLASASIGYGVAVSAMQMLDVYATIAAGGVSRPPRLLLATIDGDGTRRANAPEHGPRVVSENTASTVTGLLTEVVRGGTGACAAIPGYAVAGKTGTSRKQLESGGYTNTYMASFIGFAPADQPRLASIVVLDEPVPIYGGRAAAPVFAEIVQFALRLFRVPPTGAAASASQFDAARAHAAQEYADCTVPHGEALSRLLAQRAEAVAAAAPTGSAPGAADTLPAATTTSE